MSKTHFADDETLAYIAKLEAELERMRGHAETSQCVVGGRRFRDRGALYWIFCRWFALLNGKLSQKRDARAPGNRAVRLECSSTDAGEEHMTLEEFSWVFLIVVLATVILTVVFCVKEEGKKHGR